MRSEEMERLKKLKQGARSAVTFLCTVTVSEALMFLIAAAGCLVGIIYETLYRGFVKGREIAWSKIASLS